MEPVFHHKTHVWKRLWPLFGAWRDDQIDVGAHLIRLLVLYEDMRIEFHAFYAPDLGDLDQIDTIYRRLYFLRRIYATLLEVDGAIDQLNRSKEFRAYIAKTNRQFLREWRAAVSFFQQNHALIRDRRNLYGGHFSDAAARYARENLDHDTTGKLTMASDPQQGVSRAIFSFCLEFVGLALTADRDNKDVRLFVEEGYEFVRKAMRHATTAIQAIAYSHVLPHFGVKVTGRV